MKPVLENLESRALLSAVALNVVANGHVLPVPTNNGFVDTTTLNTELKNVGSPYEFVYLGTSNFQTPALGSQVEVAMDVYVPLGSNMKGQTLSINEYESGFTAPNNSVGTLTNTSKGVFFSGSGNSTQTYSSASGLNSIPIHSGYGSNKISGFTLPNVYTQLNNLTFNFVPGANESYSLTSNVKASPAPVPPAPVPPAPVPPIHVVPPAPAPAPAPITVSATVHQLGAHAACDESYIVLQFSGPVNPAVANNVNNYSAVRLCGAVVPFASATYNTVNHTVTLIPRSPLIFAAYNPLHIHNTVTAINLTVGSNVTGQTLSFYLT